MSCDTTIEPTVGGPHRRTEAHLCDNYPNLLVAAADLAGRRHEVDAVILFIVDRLSLDRAMRTRIEDLTGAEVRTVSDAGAVERFARLPRPVSGMLRRNLSWANGRPISPHRWDAPALAGRSFDVGFVYNPGFFLSKVVAGRSRRVVMRDSGYANYVRHRVPVARIVPRVLAGRSPFRQTWGEERWVDAIEVVRPDQVPRRVRHKASRITLEGFLDQLDPGLGQAIVQAFWGETEVPTFDGPTALVVSQPIDQLGMCSTAAKHELYADVARHLQSLGYQVVVKPHPLELEPALPDCPAIPRSFPIEGWVWLERAPFDVAVSLNSAALADERPNFAGYRVQLIPPERFYAEHWSAWPPMIDRGIRQLPAAGRSAPSPPGSDS